MPFKGDKLHLPNSLFRIVEDVANRSAPELLLTLDKGFSTGTDPYGRPWHPLAEATLAKGRRPPPLTDTGNMRGSATVTRQGTDLICNLNTPSEYHQYGTRKIPIRMVLPNDTEGLPKDWEEILNRQVEEAFARAFGGAL